MKVLKSGKNMNTLQKQQRGAVLIISLIIMLVMTLAALSSSRSILLQEKMTGAVREGHLAFQAAEAALADGEEYVEGLVTAGGFNDTGTDGLYTKSNAPSKSDMWGHANWSDSTKYKDATSPLAANVPTGKYMVELIADDISGAGDSGDANALNISQDYTVQGSEISGFRITSRGESRDSNSVRMIQAYYGKRL